MYLDSEIFKTIVRSAPLISIDLIVQNEKKEALLGLRNNRPAKGLWFVPGGRILKDESIDNAFKRICQNELNLSCNLANANFLGVYQHFYQDNFFDDTFSTHYVVLGYKISIENEPSVLPVTQHSKYRWFDKEQLLSSCDVHTNTKAYFV